MQEGYLVMLSYALIGLFALTGIASAVCLVDSIVRAVRAFNLLSKAVAIDKGTYQATICDASAPTMSFHTGPVHTAPVYKAPSTGRLRKAPCTGFSINPLPLPAAA